MIAWIALSVTLSAAPPCATNPAVRGLDYWLGAWEIHASGGSGTSRVSLSLDRCVFTETWTGAGNHRGENVLAYSVDDQTWRAFFADNHGRAHVFDRGRVAGDTAEFLSGADRVRVIREGPSRVKQIWEKSTDQGATWKTVFEGDYTRRSSAPLR